MIFKYLVKLFTLTKLNHLSILGDESKACPSDFENILDDCIDDYNEFDAVELPRICYNNVDWTYPNIVVVFGQTSRGLSRKVARKGLCFNLNFSELLQIHLCLNLLIKILTILFRLLLE